MNEYLSFTEEDPLPEGPAVLTTSVKAEFLYIDIAQPQVGIAGIELTREQAETLRDFLNGHFP
jgi:hypothetical protein